MRQRKSAPPLSGVRALPAEEGATEHTSLLGARRPQPPASPARSSPPVDLDASDLVVPGGWRRFMEAFQRLFERLSSSRDPVPSHLETLGNFQAQVTMPFCHDDPAHIESLEALWRALHGYAAPIDPAPDSPHPLLKQPAWCNFGFQNPNPTSDFRGVGILGARNLVHFATAYPNAFHRCRFGKTAPVPGAAVTTPTPTPRPGSQTAAVGGGLSARGPFPTSAATNSNLHAPPVGLSPSQLAMWQAAARIRATTGMARYPFAVAALNVSMLLLGILNIPQSGSGGGRGGSGAGAAGGGSGMATQPSCMTALFASRSATSELARSRLASILIEDAAARGDDTAALEASFGDAFCVTMRILDELWDSGACSYDIMKFNSLLAATKGRLENVLRERLSLSEMVELFVVRYA